MDIGEKIKELRKSKKMTQEELAKACNISKNALWNYENNKRTPPTDILKKISELFDVSINELIYSGNDEIDDEIIFECWDKNIDTRRKPSDIEQDRHRTAIYKAIDTMLKDKDIQDEYGYIYEDLTIHDDAKLHIFIENTIKMQIDDMKDTRYTYGIKGLLEIKKEIDEEIKNESLNSKEGE